MKKFSILLSMVLVLTFVLSALSLIHISFALYVSLHKWRIKRTDFIHLKNYVDAIGNLAYVVVFILGLLALAGVYYRCV